MGAAIDLVAEEELETGQLPLQVEQSAVVSSLHKLVDQGGGGGETHRMPRWLAAKPQPRATWVLPVPLLPMAMTFSLRSTYSHMTRALFTDGMARKSKVPRFLTVGKCAARIRLPRSLTHPGSIVPRQLYLPVGVNQFCRFTSLAWTRCWAALVR